MAVPKRRKSHSRVRTQRAHKSLKAPKHVFCSNCGAAALSHRACPACGYYRGRTYAKQEVS